MKNWLGRTFARAATSPSLQQKSTPTSQPLVALHLSNRAQWSGRDYGALAREGYQKNAVVYRCVRLISEAAASIPLCARRGSNCERGDPAESFLSRGNPMTTATEIFESFYGYLQVGGNAYFEAALVDGVPTALYALRPDRVSVLTGRDGWPAGYDYEAGGYKCRFKRGAATGRCGVHHMRLFHPASDAYGFSPLEAAAGAVDIHNEGGRWAKALLDNSARPSGALIYKGGEGAERLSDDQFERLKSELEGQHSGPSQAGRPMVLEGGLDWKAMSLSPTDMDFISACREAAREIALAFGVPPMLLGIPGDNTYANYKEANQAFWRQTIVPLVQKTARGMEGWLRPFFGDDLNIHLELDQVPALSEERAQLWTRLGAASFLTDTERREMAGLETQRVHFIDASNDYQLGLTSARDQTAETVRIIDVNVPIVMDRSFAHFMANNILSRTIERDRSLNFTLAETRLDLVVGDYISLPNNDDADIWRIESLEGLSVQRVHAQLTDAAEPLPLAGSIPAVTSKPNWIAKPILTALDIPGPYVGPLVGILGASVSAATIRGPESEITVSGGVHIGALLTDMPRGPIGRWDYQTKIDVLLPGANLSSISPEAALAGGNRFAVETQPGWEVFYAAIAELIDTDTYRLSTLIRGVDGSDADMMDMLSAGARLTWLGPSWQDLPLSDNYIGETIALTATASGRAGNPLLVEHQAKYLRPLAPVHAKLRHMGESYSLSWIRQTRQGGDNWGGLDVPIGEETEIYRVQLLRDETIIAEYEVTEPHISLSSSEITNAHEIAIAQGSRVFGWGSSLTLVV